MIEKLKMFAALARARHFGRAAEECGVTQPSLSSAIRQLEEQLGVQLVHRGSRFQGLTAEGEIVLERSQRILADVRALKDEMRAARAGLSGHLRIGVIPTALPFVAQLTRPFLARHPNVNVLILSRTSAEILEGIEQLTLDAGITYLDNEPLGRVSERPLFTEHYVFLCAKSSPYAQKDRLSWAEAAEAPLCLLSADMQNRRIIDRHLAQAGRRGKVSVESNSSLVIVTHVQSGDWASIVPAQLAALFTGSGTLVARPLGPQNPHIVGLITPHHEPQRPLVAALLETAQKLGTDQ